MLILKPRQAPSPSAVLFISMVQIMKPVLFRAHGSCEDQKGNVCESICKFRLLVSTLGITSKRTKTRATLSFLLECALRCKAITYTSKIICFFVQRQMLYSHLFVLSF